MISCDFQVFQDAPLHMIANCSLRCEPLFCSSLKQKNKRCNKKQLPTLSQCCCLSVTLCVMFRPPSSSPSELHSFSKQTLWWGQSFSESIYSMDHVSFVLRKRKRKFVWKFFHSKPIKYSSIVEQEEKFRKHRSQQSIWTLKMLPASFDSKN